MEKKAGELSDGEFSGRRGRELSEDEFLEKEGGIIQG